MKEFNLVQFKNEGVAKNKLGNLVKFITITSDNKILAKVYHRNRVVGGYSKTIAPVHEGSVEKFNLDGRKYKGTDTMFDLIN